MVENGINKGFFEDNSIASAGYGSDTLYAGFPHIYFYGNEQVADNFINGWQTGRLLD